MKPQKTSSPTSGRRQKLSRLNFPPTGFKGLGNPWLVVLNVLIIFIFSQFVAVFLVEIFSAIVHSGPDVLDNSILAQFFYVLLAEGLAAGLVIAIVKRRKVSLSTIGLGRKPKLSDAPKAAIGFLAYYLILIVASLIVSAFFPNYDRGSQDIGFNNLNGAFQMMVAFFSLVILPPLGEETLVRGYLYGGLRQKYRFIPAMLVTSLFFGAAHLFTGDSGLLWGAGLNTFVLSLVLVALRENTGALYAGMLVHALNNAIAFGFHFH